MLWSSNRAAVSGFVMSRVFLASSIRPCIASIAVRTFASGVDAAADAALYGLFLDVNLTVDRLFLSSSAPRTTLSTFFIIAVRSSDFTLYLNGEELNGNLTSSDPGGTHVEFALVTLSTADFNALYRASSAALNFSPDARMSSYRDKTLVTSSAGCPEPMATSGKSVGICAAAVTPASTSRRASELRFVNHNLTEPSSNAPTAVGATLTGATGACLGFRVGDGVVGTPLRPAIVSTAAPISPPKISPTPPSDATPRRLS